MLNYLVYDDTGYQVIHTRTVEITSAATTFDVDIVKDFGLDYLQWDASISIDIEFTDKLTAKLASVTTQVMLVDQKYKFIFNIPENFKPGLPLSYMVTIQKYDGSPAPANSMFTVSTNFNNDYSNAIQEKLVVGAAGTTEVVIAKVPVGTTMVHMEVSFNKL